MKQTPLFITFEGIDGCGKSTHLELARRWLVQAGYAVTTVREPGSTEVAEQIRKLLLDKRSVMTATTELLLYEAARADITARQIAPLLKRRHIVLCDRFFDSTTAYQGYGRKLDIRTVKLLHGIAVGKLKPDLTLLFDVDLATAFARRGKELDRLESESRAFFKRVRAGFLEIARRERTRVKVIDAGRSVEEVFADVRTHVSRKLTPA